MPNNKKQHFVEVAGDWEPYDMSHPDPDHRPPKKLVTEEEAARCEANLKEARQLLGLPTQDL